MSSAPMHPHLRLVGVERGREVKRPAREAVAAENRSAATAHLDPGDPRWALAQRTYAKLQGTALTYDRRLELLANARRLGLRPFDANLVIAIVQDNARRGEGLPETAGKLALLNPPAAKRRQRFWLRWAAALAAAAALTGAAVHWLTG